MRSPQEGTCKQKVLKSRLATVAVLRRFGTATDVGPLLQVAETGYGDLSRAAVKAALALAPGPEGAAGVLLAKQNPVLTSAAILSLRRTEWESLLPAMSGLLTHERDEFPLLALAVLVEVGDRTELQQLEAR